MDITYIPMAKGFVYLAVVLDWFSRRVLSWKLSITMEAAFCVETLEEALARHGKPEIFNTDQGSQFTGTAFTGVLSTHEIRISMDGKGAWRDNVFVERLWRSVKYEEVYLHAYDSVSAPREAIGRYLDLYNRRRPHSSLDGRTPDDAYFRHDSMPPIRLAAQPRQTFHLSKRKSCSDNRDHFTPSASNRIPVFFGQIMRRGPHYGSRIDSHLTRRDCAHRVRRGGSRARYEAELDRKGDDNCDREADERQRSHDFLLRDLV